jgi:dTDP-4-amino-4,6-dideoxygalactose transaminase
MFQVMLPEARLDARRAVIMDEMKQAGIGTGVHYPVFHLFSLYRRMGWKEGDFPNAEYAGRNLLTLPLFPAMARADVARVVRALAAVLTRHLRA